MAKQQDQDREKLRSDENSGERERRGNAEGYPQKRGAGDFGTHGGPNKHDAKSNPSSPSKDEE